MSIVPKLNLRPVAHFKQLIVQYEAPKLRPPFNENARLEAGFTVDEMWALQQS